MDHGTACYIIYINSRELACEVGRIEASANQTVTAWKLDRLSDLHKPPKLPGFRPRTPGRPPHQLPPPTQQLVVGVVAVGAAPREAAGRARLPSCCCLRFRLGVVLVPCKLVGARLWLIRGWGLQREVCETGVDEWDACGCGLSNKGLGKNWFVGQKSAWLHG